MCVVNTDTERTFKKLVLEFFYLLDCFQFWPTFLGKREREKKVTWAKEKGLTVVPTRRHTVDGT